MASNELEVLDPAAPVEKIEGSTAGRALNRRNLFAGLGIAGAAIGAGLVTRRSAPRPSVVEAASFASTFTQTDYLNFLLNIKYLQATFYSYITQGADIPAQYTVNGTLYRPTFGTALVNDALSKVTFSGANAAQITDMLNEIYYDELNQLINLQTLIGPLQAIAITRPLMDLLGTNKNIAAGGSPTASTITSPKALAQARLLEDLSVTAFAGVAGYLTGNNLTSAAQIFAVDGCHAGAIRLAIILQNAAAAGTVVDLVSQSDIVPVAPGNFLNVQPDDVAPVDPLSAATSATGPQLSAAPVLTSSQVQLTNCTAPLAPFTPTFVANTTTGSAVLAVTSFPSNWTIVVGQSVTGAGIPSGATVASVSTSASTVTLSANATATATGVTLSLPITGCTREQFQGFFNTTGNGPGGTASISSPPAAGFAFKRTPSQVLSVLFASAPGAAPAAPALPSTQVPPISTVVTSGGFFPQGVGGQITVAVDS